MSDPNCENYLGKKGYTIKKSSISVDEQQNIRQKLKVRPYVPNSPVKGDEFEIYRESNSKLYIPRYFGIQCYGQPKECKLKEPESIDLNFASS